MSHFQADIHSTRLHEALKRLPREIVIERAPLEAVYAVTPEPVPFADRLSLSYRPIREGEAWGQNWDCGWFHVQGRIPDNWKGSAVIAQLDFMGEALVLDGGGEPLCGLTSGSVFDAHFNKDMLHLHQACQGGEAVDLWIDAGSNLLFGLPRTGDPTWEENPERIHGHHTSSLAKMRLCRFDSEKWHLWLDLSVLSNLADSLKDRETRRIQILRGCGKALDALAIHGAAAAREALRPLFELPTDPAAMDVYGIGHAHIDTGWLWPVRESIRKCGRSFASQLSLLEKYPTYLFGASQAQHYAFAKKYYPSIYQRIKQAVAAGRWEVQGGMWVEADCNLIGGEAMVRQFIHGKNFFMDEFGIDVKNLWLPDVFGYSGNLPQILRRAGMEYFLTQKLSWSRYNKFPHSTFIWRGIDGSEVLAHFPPENSYNSSVMPSDILKNESNNQEAGLVQEAISLFGIGDGGGGPKEEHIERALRLHNLNGCPRYHFSFAQPILEKLAEYRDELATWCGELYLEFHRGTLTTQAAVKRWNRRAEEALRATESLCAAAGLDTYPSAELDSLWKTVLINQFHDIIPGSSINRVYAETVPQLCDTVEHCNRLARAAAERMLAADNDALTLFNPSSTAFNSLVSMPAGWTGAQTESGLVEMQDEDGVCMARVSVPANSFVTLRRDQTTPAQFCIQPANGNLVLENRMIRYTFDANLRLLGAYDKQADRDISVPGAPGNVIELYDDHPHYWDAWEIDEYYRKMRVASAAAESGVTRIKGPLRTGLRATLRIGNSVLQQTAWLESDSKRLDFVTEADWNERHKLLRVEFPTVMVAAEAKFEIQYGHVTRATHDNTKWQFAQFEAVGHRWADLSERDYGVALLNNCKYGYRVKGGALEMSLLRAPTEPDPVADIGKHEFTYSLLPHAGDFASSDVLVHAAILNQGVSRFAGLAADRAVMPVSFEGEGIELAVVKRAEKSNHLVVRIVESRGLTANCVVRAADPARRFVETDLMEWHDGKPSDTAELHFTLSPFEIRTWKVV